jgi:AcrR family transcriptional regulator
VRGETSAAPPQKPAYERIVHAAMHAFMELGYARTSTLEIATRAQVSKRELYALFGGKQAILAACITDRAQRMRLPPEFPPARTREELAAVLVRLGATVMREVSDPAVMGVFRLAIAEAQAAPEVARTLEATRQSVRGAVIDVLAKAQSAGLLDASDPSEMAAEFLAMLWGDLMISVLLRVREAPGPAETKRRAQQAATALLQLHPSDEGLPGLQDG